MRSHLCAALGAGDIGQSVELCGWAASRRDHGGVIFIDLRDHSGLVQLVADPDAGEHFARADEVRPEYVLRACGRVRERSAQTRNPDMATGMLEVYVDSLQILSRAEPPAIPLDEYGNAGEEARLRHRYLDLRRPAMQALLRLRAQVASRVRAHLQRHDFLEVETPILTRPTPEGARDYLVPSRTQPGLCFALPQSPQLFKQLLMMSGCDRYYQIARCFRDEDLRADRQPEFTQIDIEASFVDERAVMDIAEGLVRDLFEHCAGVRLPDFARLSYAEAMALYGSDKPDLRIPLQLVDIADLVRDLDFKVFSGPAADDGSRVVVMRLAGGAELSRKQLDDYTALACRHGARGMAWIKVLNGNAGAEGLQSPIVKFLPPQCLDGILRRAGALDGDILLFGAGKAATVNDSMAALRTALADDRGLHEGDWAPLWVVDFPMFERDAQGRWSALHHPFTAPREADAGALAADPGGALSRGYDLVLNGVELGGGSIRISDAQLQAGVFAVLGMDERQARAQFGFLLDALRYGCPPHGGIAFGMDRLVAMLGGRDSIRDVIAFPKTQSAACPMTGAPAGASAEQWRELGLRALQGQQDKTEAQ